jgi:hypothetical protein
MSNCQSFSEEEEEKKFNVALRKKKSGNKEIMFGSVLTKHSQHAPSSFIKNWFTGTKLCYKYSQ